MFFFGIFILSGYNSLPGKTYYLDPADDMINNSVTNAMRHGR